MKVLLLSFFISFGYAKNASVNVVMKEMAKTYQDLIPIFLNKNKFMSATHQKNIDGKIEKMVKLLGKVEGHFNNGIGPMNHNLALGHFKDTLEVFRGPNKEFSAEMLKGGGQLCLSCHTRDSAGRALFIPGKNASWDEFTNADFHYFTRGHKKSVSLYLDLIQKNKNELQTEMAMKRVMTQFVRVKYRPIKAITILKTWDENAKLWNILKKERKDWMKALKWLSVNDKNSAEKFNLVARSKYLKDLRKFGVNLNYQKFDESHFIYHLRLSGLLTKYGQTQLSKSERPEILYKLGRIEWFLSESLFFSMSDIYLKTCMEDFPKSPIAKKCFKEWVNQTEFSFTGSAGTQIPVSIQRKIEYYEKIILR